MAASNASTKEKTLLGIVRTRPSDTWQIDNLMTYMNFKNHAIFQRDFLLDDFRDYFDTPEKTEEVVLDKKFHYLPTGFSEFYYGTPDLDFLVMYFAKISTLFDFNKKTIHCLKPEYLKEINKLMVSLKDQVEESKNNPEIILQLTTLEI